MWLYQENKENREVILLAILNKSDFIKSLKKTSDEIYLEE